MPVTKSKKKVSRRNYAELSTHIKEIGLFIHHNPEYLPYLGDLVGHIQSKGTKELFSRFKDQVESIDLSKIGRDEVENLRNSIRSWIEEFPLSMATPSIIWILSKLNDKRDIPFVQRFLNVYLNSSKNELWGLGQSISALSNLGEKIISKASFLFNEYKTNISDAERYLLKQEKRKNKKPK